MEKLGGRESEKERGWRRRTEKFDLDSIQFCEGDSSDKSASAIGGWESTRMEGGSGWLSLGRIRVNQL